VVNYVVIVEVKNPDLKLMPGLTANLNIYVVERKHIFKVPSNALNFIPPAEYIQSDALLADSMSRKWERKLQQKIDLKKQEIGESNQVAGYIWLKKEKDIFPVAVAKGISDGVFTEITGDVQEGDEVVTVGGMLGKVSKMGDSHIGLEVSNGVELQVQRSAVVQVLPKGSIK
jgi:multidrug efflux pump subunit AcrA (membrane-fusion protein)